MEQLITDRTQEDADYAFFNQHIPDLKGAYNASDMNRVGKWVNYLGKMFAVPVLLKTNWNKSNIPNESDFNVYLDGVRAVRSAVKFYKNPPDVPGHINELSERNGWDKANDIERNLSAINRVLESFAFAGEIYAGEFQ